MSSLHAVQLIPKDFAAEPDLVTNILTGRVEFLLNRVVDAGHNPIDGTLTIEPSRHTPLPEVRFTWTPIE